MGNFSQIIDQQLLPILYRLTSIHFAVIFFLEKAE